VGITDKITGRAKQAAGDLLGHDELKGEGQREERKGEAKEDLASQHARLEREEDRTERQADRVERLERTT
jgi:uncharacterized protein YjbJ (UPF0337 family)